MIKNYIDLYKYDSHTKGTKGEEVECMCENCGSVFSTEKRKSPYRRILKNKEVLCHKCAVSKSSKLNHLKGVDKLNEIRHIKREKNIILFKEQEEKELPHRIYTLDELKEWKSDKHRACTLICSECGKELPLINKHKISKYISNHNSPILCKRCGISSTKVSNNFSKISDKMLDCKFNENQTYIGCEFEKPRDERPRYLFTCTKCGNTFTDSFGFGDEIPVSCPTCHPLKGQVSYGEKELLSFIESIYDGEIISNTRKVISPYELDIYLPEKRLAFEFDGVYWHNNSKKTYDKYRLCRKNNIRLIMIYDYEWETNKEIIKDMVKSQLGIFDVRIGARECELRNVPIKDAETFLKENHIQGSPLNTTNKNTVCVGLYHNNELVQIETFNKPRFNSRYDWELIRECSKRGYQIYGGKDKILKEFRKNNKGGIISYCDKRFFNGNSYIKEGFSLSKESPPSYRYYKNGNLLSREKCMKHKLKNFLEHFDEKLSETENMINNRYLKLWDFGNFVFTLE